MSQFVVSPLFLGGSGALALAWAFVLIQRVLSASEGTEKMREVAGAVRSGAEAYLARQSKTISIFAVIIGIALWYVLGDKLYAIGFWLGAILSGAAGYIGMTIAVRANVRTAQASAESGLRRALQLAYNGGAVTGLFVVGLALLAVVGFYFITGAMGLDLETRMKTIVAIGFGSSLISLFARIGGGIYTKAADVGADLVGKVEAKIPEDDPRNPATIADNVGDNVGDCAGMAADVFETYAVTAISCMLFGYLTFKDSPSVEMFILFPLALAGIGIVGSVLGSLFAKLGSNENIMGALYKSLYAAALFTVLGFFFLVPSLIPADAVANAPDYGMKLFWAAGIGIVVGLGLFGITEYYTATRYKPVREIAKASESGAGTNIIAGLAYGLESTFFPVVLIALGIIGAYLVAQPYGLYGVAVATMGMLSLSGVIITLDSYGPITDNAAGIAEMSGLPKEARVHLDKLDAVGNTTKAVTKTFAIGSAGLASLTLFAAYVEEFKARNIEIHFSLEDPAVIVGLLLGGAIPFLFAAFLMRSVGRAAFAVIGEVRRQFREISGILEGTAKPDYARAVDIVTRAALKEMTAPALIAVVSPIVVGYFLGPVALGGFLLGVILTGIFIALSMANGGAAWDNAKKYIEEGHHGGKHSEAHAAAVVGDTVGDPYKDTAGPAVNPLIKVINMVAILLAALLVENSLRLFN